ncbi:MAG: hypothetical protein INR73_25800 [Williamsia sp.]|nr:hypothetical protein [Williamsia sp.]
MLLFFIVVHSAVQAQKGANEIKVIGEGAFALPMGNGWSDDFITGFGLYVKGYYGIGSSGQLTAMVGVSKFKNNASFENSKTNTHMIPVLLGYKQHIKRFYIEPQAGLGEMGGKIDWGVGDYSRPSVTTLYAGLGMGVDVKRFEFGLRYQYAKGIDAPEAGIWSNRSFEFLGAHVGYRIF